MFLDPPSSNIQGEHGILYKYILNEPFLSKTNFHYLFQISSYPL